MEIGIKKAQVNLSKLVKAAMEGERVVITNAGEEGGSEE
jgi:prevent-host-death family protein